MAHHRQARDPIEHHIDACHQSSARAEPRRQFMRDNLQQVDRRAVLRSDIMSIDFETIFSELPRYLLKNLDLATAPAQGSD